MDRATNELIRRGVRSTAVKEGDPAEGFVLIDAHGEQVRLQQLLKAGLVVVCRLGEIRDRSFEQQRYRAGGLTLVTAAIAPWNTVYIERAVQNLARNGQALDPELFKSLSPLGWEHINLTGDYQWKGTRLAQGRLRPLRTPNHP